MTMSVLRLSFMVLLETKIERKSHVKRMSADETLVERFTILFKCLIKNIWTEMGFPISPGWAVRVAGGSLIQKHRIQKKSGFDT